MSIVGDNMRIYIIGPSGAGKTTFSKKLAKKYSINAYELDCIVYDDENGHLKRTDEEIENIFINIISQDSWIIEDVGRTKFDKALEYCDIIYYLKIPKFIVYKRVVKRWIKQKLGKENYNYPPTFYQFYDMLRIAKLYFKHEKDKLKKIKKYEDKVKYLSNRDLDSI